MSGTGESPQTYDVGVTAYAIYGMRVRARSAREALDIAATRLPKAGPWTINFPGAEDEHWTVSLGDVQLGPDAQGGMADEIEDSEGVVG